MQYKANIQQRYDIAIERFESNLFEMIHIQQEIINGLKVETIELEKNRVLASGRDVFQFVYEAMPLTLKIGDNSEIHRLKEALINGKEVKMRLNLIEGLALWITTTFIYIDYLNTLMLLTQ